MKNRFLKGNKFRKEEVLKKALATGALSAMILGVPVLASANEETNASANNVAAPTETTSEEAPETDINVFTYSLQAETSTTTTSDTVTTTEDSAEVETPTEPTPGGGSQIPDGDYIDGEIFEIFKNTPIVELKEGLQKSENFKGQEVRVFDKDGKEVTDPNALILEGYTLIIGNIKFEVLINEEVEYRPEWLPDSFIFSNDISLQSFLDSLIDSDGNIVFNYADGKYVTKKDLKIEFRDADGNIVTEADSIKGLTMYIEGYKVELTIDPKFFEKDKIEKAPIKQPQTIESALESVRDQLKELSASEGAKVVAKAVKETITSIEDAVKVIAEAKIDNLSVKSSKEEVAEALGKVSAAVSKLVELGNSEQAVEALADIVTKLDGKVDIESLKALLTESLSNKDLLKSLSAKLGNVSKELSDLIATLLTE